MVDETRGGQKPQLTAGRACSGGEADRPESRQYLHGRGTAIQRVEVNAGSAALQQLDALGRRVRDAKLHHCFRIVPPAVELFSKAKGQGSTAEHCEALN